jgi:ribosomal subunit interface protein
MTLPVQITFRDLESSEAVEALIHERAERLSRHSDRIRNCRVVVATIQHRHETGGRYRVTVELDVPRSELVASHDHGDVYEAVRDAFDAVTNRLEHHVARMRDARRRVAGSAGRAERAEALLAGLRPARRPAR